MDSSIQELLKPNCRLTDIQLAKYKANLKTTRRRIARLQQELAEELKRERCYELLTSPMRQIPDDVLQEIFLQCLPETLNECQRSVRKAPLLLCLVCSRWRSVANATVGLWKNIFIEGPPNSRWILREPERRRYLEWVDLWVERSRQAPLNLYLDLGNLRASHDAKSMSDMEYELDKLLKPIGHRIHHLTFISHSLHDLIHAFDSVSFSTMRSILFNDTGGKRSMFHGVPSRFLASPHLHTLDFSGIDWAMEVVPDVGTNIIRLSMRNVNPYDITRISRKLPNLQHACFAIVEGDLAKGETLEFPHLTSLSLDFELHHSPDFQAVMKAIRTPSLTTLHLRLRKHLTEGTKWFEQGQLPTIFPRLFEFHLNIALTNSALSSILERCVKIQRCYFAVQNCNAAFTLFSHTEALQRCIHLEEIQLEYAGAVFENNLVDMIESRSMHQPPKSARLRKVRVYSSGRVASRNVEQKPLPTSLDVSIERYCSWVYRGDGRRAETKRIWDERYASTGPVSKTLEPYYYSSESESEEDSEDWSDDY